MTLRRYRVAAGIVAALWLASLALPVAVEKGGDWWWGYQVLGKGWLGLDVSPGWLGNLAIGPALRLLARARAPSRSSGAVVGGLALFCAASAVWWHDIPDDDPDMPIYPPDPIHRYGPGYYLWIVAVGAAGALVLKRAFPTPDPRPNRVA